MAVGLSSTGTAGSGALVLVTESTKEKKKNETCSKRKQINSKNKQTFGDALYFVALGSARELRCKEKKKAKEKKSASEKRKRKQTDLWCRACCAFGA